MTPINKHTEKTTYKDEEVEVIGEVFPEPIADKPDEEFYTRVCIMNRGACLKRIFYRESMIHNDDLQNVVKKISETLDKYI